MAENIHDGHRKRIEEKLLNHGFSSLSQHELLEFLLFFALPRRDTNPIAHNLINHFGSFNKVLEASVFELTKVEGIGKTTALYISSFLPMIKEYLLGALGNKQIFKTTGDLKKYFEAICMGNKYECAYAMYLDKSKRLLKVDKLSEGSLDYTSIHSEKILEASMLYGAYYIVIAHNHTSGYVMPSPQDIIETQILIKTLSAAKKLLLDSIIVDHSNLYSFAEMGIIKDFHVINPYEPKVKLNDNFNISTFHDDDTEDYYNYKSDEFLKDE